MMTSSSIRLDPDGVSAAIVTVSLGLAAETQLEPSARSSVDQSRMHTEVHAQRLLKTKTEFIPHPSFDDPTMYPTILGPMPANSVGQEVAQVNAPAGVSPLLAGLYGDPLLTREQEAHLFRKMNFLKHRSAWLRSAVNPATATAADLDHVEALLKEGLALKNQIIRANLRLVVSLVRKLSGPNQEFAELVSDGYLALIRAIEKFDFSRGYKFSTYASWAIMRNLSRDSRRNRRRDRLVTGYETMLVTAPDHRNDECLREREQKWCQQAVRAMLGGLNDRDRQIIVSRFGLEGTGRKTLAELGKELGITKERVRQLETRACARLRKVAEEQELDLLAF
jgi:RNA polymerase primary sigma factor